MESHHRQGPTRTAPRDSDYSGVPSTVSFATQETPRRPSPILAATDRSRTTGESVKLTFSNLPTGVTRRGPPRRPWFPSLDVASQGSTTVKFGAAVVHVGEGSSTTVKIIATHRGTERSHPHHQDRSGRCQQRRLLRRPGQRTFNAATRKSLSLRPRRTAWTTTVSRSSWDLDTQPARGITRAPPRRRSSPSPTTTCRGDGGVRRGDLQRGRVGRRQHHGDQGERGLGHRQAVRRPGADGDHPHHQDRPGRRHQRRLLRSARPASPSTQGTPRRPSPSPPPPTPWTTTGSR